MYILYFLYCVYGGKSNALIIAHVLGFCNLFIMSLTILTLASPNTYNILYWFWEWNWIGDKMWYKFGFILNCTRLGVQLGVGDPQFLNRHWHSLTVCYIHLLNNSRSVVSLNINCSEFPHIVLISTPTALPHKVAVGTFL